VLSVDAHTRVVADSLRREDIEVRPDEAKFGELLLLVAEELADDRFGGATKVNKVLYFAEFAHVRETGYPITGMPYRKLPNGPAPRHLRPARERLVRQGAAEVVTERVLGYEQHRLRPLRAARREMFTEVELRAVDDAVALLRGRTGSEASDLSHREPGWRMVEDGEDIPFVTAYLPQEQPPPSERMRARMREFAADYARQGRIAQ
jgi:hypothetical protein